MGSRIIAVCDAYDAMTTQRVYNRPVSPHEALARLRDAAGSQFDPTVVGVVCAVIQEVLGSDLARSVESALPEILAPNLTSVPPGTLFA